MLYFYFMFLDFYIQFFYFIQCFYFVCEGCSIHLNKIFRVEEAERDKSPATSAFPWLKQSVREWRIHNVIHFHNFCFTLVSVCHSLCLSEVSEQDTLATICHHFYFHCTALIAMLFVFEGFIQ